MPFDSNGIFEGNPSPESSWLLGEPSNLIRLILYGVYFRRTTEPTRSSRQANETPGAGAADDSRFSPVKTLLTDGELSAATLLENYLHQLVQDQREQFDDDGGYIAFPKRSVVEQYTQLRALTDAGLLDSSQTLSFETTPMIDEYDSRDDRLAQFLESHAALDGDPRRAVFILGGLVGRITAYQDYEGISSTLVRRYPVDYLTKQTVQEVTKEVLQMNNYYAEAEDSRSYQTLNRYTDRLPDLMLSATPNEWSLTEAELQWLYSLGIAYGLSDTSLDTDDEQSAEQPLAADAN
jgi:CRISPR-associated protein Cas8b/Csh1 subtype I-B